MTQQRDPVSPNDDSPMRILEPPLDAAVTDLIAKLLSELGEIPVAAVEAHNTLVRANAVYAAALSSRYESLDISVSRFNLLRHLYHAEEHRLTMSELGAYMNVSVPNVMRMVQALDGEGWLRCEKSVQDRRVTFVELTEDGYHRFAAFLPRVLEIWQELWADFSDDDIAVLSGLLSRLRANLLRRYIGQPGLIPYRLEQQRRAEQNPSWSTATSDEPL